MTDSYRRSPGRRVTGGLAVLIVGVFLAASATAVARIAASPREAAIGRGAAGAVGASMAGTPQRVRIPAIGVDAPMGALGLNADGTLAVPPYEEAGWYDGRPKPGENGAAVVVAHVDSTTGPAVFYRLGSLAPGDQVSVDYDDGTSVDFTVASLQSYPKSEFPTQAVYGPTDGPELRLITCGGSFDRQTQSYEDNVVVWATPTIRPPSTPPL